MFHKYKKKRSAGNINVNLNFCSYTIKADLKGATYIGSSNLGAKSDLV